MKLFIITGHCTSGLNCQKCRDQAGGRTLRAQWGGRYELPPIAEGNAAADFECPNGKPWNWKQGDEFTKPRKQKKPAAAPNAWGPKLWAELHRRHRLWTGAAAERIWLAEFATRIQGGCGCRGHWGKVLKEHPPDLSGPDAYYEWTVMVHNIVNARLGKPQWTST